jgi:hypothetical protein
MDKLSEDYDDEYDACVKINNPEIFFKVLSDETDDLIYLSTSACRYKNRFQHYKDNSIPPFLIKPPEYAYQYEVRSVWKPKEKSELKSIQVKSEKIKQYCEMLYVFKKSSDEFNDRGKRVVNSETFNNDVILLNNNTYINCKFKNCIFVYDGDDGFIELGNNEFWQPSLELSGPASNTLNFMKTIYHSLGDFGKRVIDELFENIKKTE